MSKHVSKFNVMVYLSILIAVFTMFIGTSYSYYIKKSNEIDNRKNNFESYYYKENLC